jgi:glycosyltransferase involved in cell wall biosynthesis
LSLKILNVAYALLPVDNGSGGGAEQILSLVDRGLVESGHNSLVIAAAGSQLAGVHIPTQALNGRSIDAEREKAHREHRRRIQETLLHHDIDLIHFHGLDFEGYLPDTSVPKLATLHLPVAWYPKRIFEVAGLNLVCVSKTQAKTVPPDVAASVVPNGIDLSAFRPTAAKSGSLLWLGRVCPEKGTAIALRVAHRLGRRLTIAGPVHTFRSHKAYFRHEVEPLLDRDRRYIGPVDLAGKRKLLSEAHCLLIPSLAPETSSLVAMEAAASGTAVVAFRSGALPEVVEDAKTGFIVEDEAGMTQIIEQANLISPQRCREHAERHFDFRKMVAGYLKLYERILAGSLTDRTSAAPTGSSR